VVPRENPAATIYGLLALAALLAAESGRHESYLDTILSAIVAALLYWLLHSYATVLGDRLAQRERLSARGLAQSLFHDWALLRGAAIPLSALLAAWAAGASQKTGVLIALWTAVVCLVLFELAAGMRARSTPRELAIVAGVGLTMGLGVLLLRILLLHH
jgi:uncharacterized membrane protein YvlD (DUF360 family)